MKYLSQTTKTYIHDFIYIVILAGIGFCAITVSNLLLFVIKKTVYEIVSIFFLMILTSNIVVKVLLHHLDGK